MNTGNNKYGCEENYIRQHLENYVKKANIHNAKFKIETCGKKGDNFVGMVFRVTIEGEKDGKMETVHGILKLASTEQQHRLSLMIRRFFLQEIQFFKEVLPIFNNAGLTIPNIPRVLYENKNEMQEALLSEDLSIRGFVNLRSSPKMNKREKKIMNYEHASLALRSLGRFHANSFIIRDKSPDAFNKLKQIKEPLLTYFKHNNNRVQILLNIVKQSMSDEDEHYVKKVEEFERKFFDYVEYIANGNNAEPYAVICHGDFWTNNLLFRYDEDSIEPKDVCFVDFQMFRYASPATDIAYMVFCCCGHEVREKYYEMLIKEYHDSLSKYLEEAGCDPQKLFPYKELLNQLRLFGKYGAMMAIFVAHLFTACEKDILPEMGHAGDDQTMMENLLKTNSCYKKTLKYAFKDTIDMNYL